MLRAALTLIALAVLFRAEAPWAVTFTDVAAEAGLREVSVYGGVDRKRFIIETNGAGIQRCLFGRRDLRQYSLDNLEEGLHQQRPANTRYTECKEGRD